MANNYEIIFAFKSLSYSSVTYDFSCILNAICCLFKLYITCCPYQFPPAGAMRLFGRDNITVSEFFNPAHTHFRSFSVARAECHVAGGGDTWHAGDTW